jgi:hypothetical protein
MLGRENAEEFYLTSAVQYLFGGGAMHQKKLRWI